MLNMMTMNKISKVALGVSLLMASGSYVHAMDPLYIDEVPDSLLMLCTGNTVEALERDDEMAGVWQKRIDKKAKTDLLRKNEEINLLELNLSLKNTLGGILPDGWNVWNNRSLVPAEIPQGQEGKLSGEGSCFGFSYDFDLSPYKGKKAIFTADIESNNPGPYVEFVSTLHLNPRTCFFYSKEFKAGDSRRSRSPPSTTVGRPGQTKSN
jgi:hypothetical protein